MRYSSLLFVLLLAPLAWACEQPEDMSPLGEAKLRVWGFPVYTAKTLVCPDTRLGDGSYVQGPMVLQLTYERDISRRALVDATREQWQRLEREHHETEAWLAELSQLWPDVKAGDQLSLYLDAAGRSQFLLNGRLLGGIDDQAFGPDFVAIWLHPAASYPQLRMALLGGES